MARPDALVGSVVAGRYEVLRLLGKGGMGAVYEVRHRALGRHFALKRLVEGLADDEEALARFRREAEVVAALHHPNIVEVVDWETLDDGTPCMVLELLRGEDLGQRIQRVGPLAWSEIATIGDAALAALGVAHRAGIVHRDLKPHNVFLSRDDAGGEHVKLLDFGISRWGSRAGVATSDQRVLGTPLYMAPEQADGAQELVGPASDLWAMGAMLYEMATGAVAFEAPTAPAVLYRVCFGAPDPLVARRPDAPPAFVALVERALTRDARARIADAEALRALLRAALADAALRAVPPPARVPSSDGGARAGAATTLSLSAGQEARQPPSRATRWLPIAGAAALLAVGIGVTVWRVVTPTTARVAPSPPPPMPTPAAPTPVVTPLEVAPPPSPATRAVRLTVTPRGAHLTLDGGPIEGDAVPLPVDDRPHRLRVEAPGHVAETLTLGAHTPDALTIRLRPRPRVPPHPQPPGDTPPAPLEP